MRDPDRPQTVTSITGAIERRELARARTIAERSHRRELIVLLESVEARHRFESGELEDTLAELARSDDPEAVEAAARVRCMSAMYACAGEDEAKGLAGWEAVMAEHPRMALPYVMRAQWWLEKKKEPDRAMADLERAMSLEPNDAGAYYWRGQCHEAADDPERALANFRRAAALEPSIDVLHALAKALSLHGEPVEARSTWNRLIAMAPGYVDFHLGRGDYLAEQGDHTAALADYDRVVAIDPTNEGLRFSRALRMSLAGRVAEAADELQALSDAAPDNAVYLRTLGELYTRSSRPELAVAPLSRAIDLEPSAEALALRARAHRALGDPRAALADFDRSLAIDPSDDLAALERLTLLPAASPKDVGSDGVQAEIERLAARLPQVSSLATMHAIILGARGDHAGAIAAYDRAITLDPDADADTYLKRGIQHARLEHVKEAFDDASRALERDPRLAAAWVARGVYRAHLEDDPAAALADVDRGIELAPEDVSAHFYRHGLLFTMEDYEGAMEECEKAIALAPRLGQLYFERASCRAQLEEEPEGWHEANIADYGRALDSGYRESVVFAHKSITEQNVGDLTAAIATLDAGIVEHPGDGWLFYHRGTFKRTLGDVEGASADLARATALGFAYDVE